VARSALGLLQHEFYGSVMRPKVTGRALIPHNRNTIVVANHASHLDMGLVKYALGSYGRDLVALAARDYFFEASPLRRALVENFTNLAPIDRRGGLRQTLKDVGRLLAEGRTVLIFPEGTRSPDGLLREFKPAVGHLALHCEVDILPVYLGGTFEALPRDAVVPTRRELLARIGPPLTVPDLRRLSAGLRPADAARAASRLAQRAVAALRDGDALDLARLAPDEVLSHPPRRHPVVSIFDELPLRFVPGGVEAPVSFYFTLGAEPEAKWTVRVDRTRCEVTAGKPAGAAADCVLKTSPEMFARIVREGYTPSVPEFVSGAIKSNDVALLQTFARAFQLG
jgi:long-chain acyl-CoA synthetase